MHLLYPVAPKFITFYAQYETHSPRTNSDHGEKGKHKIKTHFDHMQQMPLQIIVIPPATI